MWRKTESWLGMIMTRITNWEMWHLDYFLAFIASLGKSLHLYILGLGLTDVGIDIKSLHRESLQLSPQFLTMVVWFTCSVLFLKWSKLLSYSLRHTKLLLIRYIVPVCEYDWLNNSNIRAPPIFSRKCSENQKKKKIRPLKCNFKPF